MPISHASNALPQPSASCGQPAWTRSRELTIATARAAGHSDCSIRVILARGPGSFSVNPYEIGLRPALYIVAYGLSRAFMEVHPAGATLRRSTIPAKPAEMAEIKNCNYLPNVLMKREAVDWGVDFVVGYDVQGHLTEGPTENAGIITRDGELAFPRLENILAGTTMLRLAELAKTLLSSGELRAIRFRDIDEDEVRNAREVLTVGTTINVVAVRAYEGKPVGDGRPGPLTRRLNALLEEDILRKSRHAHPSLIDGLSCGRSAGRAVPCAPGRTRSVAQGTGRPARCVAGCSPCGETFLKPFFLEGGNALSRFRL